MVEEDEEEDLLPTLSSDNDDLSENDENEALDRASERVLTQLHTDCLQRVTFVACVLVLVVASTCVLVLLPTFTASLAAHGDAYTALLFLSAASTVVFFATATLLGAFFGFREMLALPYGLPKMARCSLAFGLGGVLVVYSMDRHKVLCHLQDPIKGVVLIASLVFYFCLCRKVLGLRKIFAATAVVAGVFISVDYGLCDEFRCRGFERLSKGDDDGGWPWPAHAVWTMVYVAGLTLWTLHFTLLEEMLGGGGLAAYRLGYGSGLLATVSRLVFTRDASRTTLLEDETTPTPTPRQGHVAAPGLRAVSVAAWTHLVALILVVSLSWTDMIGVLGGTSSSEAFWNVTTSGISCLLTSTPECPTARLSGWLLVLAYSAFALSSLQLLIVSQSSVLVVATSTIALPLSGLWWSAFSLSPVGDITSSFSGITGELVCSLLGLPVVATALGVMCKSFVVAPVKEPRRRGDPSVLHA